MSPNPTSGSDPGAVWPSVTGVEDVAGEDVARAISREIVRVYMSTFGRGPIRARTFSQPHFSACVLRGVLTAGERALVVAGAGELVEDSLRRRDAGVDGDLLRIVEGRTGREVQRHVVRLDIAADLAAHVFFYE